MSHYYDRTGERHEEDDQPTAPKPHHCDRGWVTVTDEPLVVRRCSHCADRKGTATT